MTAADEIQAAAEKLRTATFRGAMTATPAVAALVRAREPLAAWLEREAFRVLTNGGNPDLHHALTVARAILGTQETP